MYFQFEGCWKLVSFPNNFIGFSLYSSINLCQNFAFPDDFLAIFIIEFCEKTVKSFGEKAFFNEMDARFHNESAMTPLFFCCS